MLDLCETVVVANMMSHLHAILVWKLIIASSTINVTCDSLFEALGCVQLQLEAVLMTPTALSLFGAIS